MTIQSDQRKNILIQKIIKTGDIRIECLPENIAVRGNALASGDDDEDRKEEDRILSELEWNQWAWCIVKVSIEYCGITEHEYLGGCCYESEKQFREDGSFDDLVEECATTIYLKMMAVHQTVQELTV